MFYWNKEQKNDYVESFIIRSQWMWNKIGWTTPIVKLIKYSMNGWNVLYYNVVCFTFHSQLENSIKNVDSIASNIVSAK